MSLPLTDRMLAKIPGMHSADDLRIVMRNATTAGNEAVRAAAFDRLVRVSASDHDDPIARACWEMIHAVEEIRRATGRRVWRMQRLRPKITREGERAAIEYCATHPTDGFQEVLDYGRPEYTAEAILLSHPDDFQAPESRATARSRLLAVGIDPARFETIPSAADQ